MKQVWTVVKKQEEALKVYNPSDMTVEDWKAAAEDKAARLMVSL